MHRIITGATGLIGQALVANWHSQCRLTVIGRSKQKIKNIFGNQVEIVTWDDLTPDYLQSAQAIIHLAGENVGEKRWSELRKQEILSSRIETTTKLASMLALLKNDSPPLFAASAISVYGSQTKLPTHLPNESSSPDNETPHFLTVVANACEKAAEPAIHQGVRVILMRFSVVLAKNGGAFPRLVAPFRFFLGGPIGSGQQPFSWIMIDDVVRAINFLLTQAAAKGPFNFVAPQVITQAELAKAIGKILHRPAVLPLPALVVRALLGEMGQELLLQGQSAYPERLLALGFNFNYPNIQSALQYLLK